MSQEPICKNCGHERKSHTEEIPYDCCEDCDCQGFSYVTVTDERKEGQQPFGVTIAELEKLVLLRAREWRLNPVPNKTHRALYEAAGQWIAATAEEPSEILKLMPGKEAPAQPEPRGSEALAQELAQKYLMRRDNRFHHESYMPECRTELVALLLQFATKQRTPITAKEVIRFSSKTGSTHMTDREQWGELMAEQINTALDEFKKSLDIPELEDFCKGVVIEAAHQRKRWGDEHDASKAPEDWFWVIGYLAGKAMNAQKSGDIEKFKHHLITGAALLANWHARVTGKLPVLAAATAERTPARFQEWWAEYVKTHEEDWSRDKMDLAERVWNAALGGKQ